MLIATFLTTLKVILVSFNINPLIHSNTNNYGEDDNKALTMPQLGPQRKFAQCEWPFPCYEGVAFNGNATKKMTVQV